MTDKTIIQRIDAIESRFAIEDLIAKYAQAFDTHDEDMLKGIWHDGATLSLGEALGEHVGVDAILAFARENWAAMPHMHHWMANAIIAIEGDGATGLSSVDSLVTHAEMGQLQISGLYRDRYERKAGRWAIATRSFELHFMTPLKNWEPVAGSETPVKAA